MTIILLAIHILAAVFWVGGMAFAHQVLRPAALGLEPPERLALWNRVFQRFFPAVAGAIVALLLSGIGLVFSAFGGFAGLPLAVHVMIGTGILMMALFLHLVFAPWARFRRAVADGRWPDAAGQLNQIRALVGINLVLGAVTVIAGSTARYW